jgi:hypothetical protein
MSEPKSKINIVRDRTLVLRILVPGLHTRLNDKINTLQETEGAVTPTAGGVTKADKILNLEGVACLPSSIGSTLWHFRYVECVEEEECCSLVDFRCVLFVDVFTLFACYLLWLLIQM